VLGNYSRFVRPGAVRVHAESDSEVVRVSAYVDPSTGALTLVAINNSVEAQPVTFADMDQHSVNVYETSDAHDLTLIYTGPAQDTNTLAASSVTTFVFDLNEGT
jgi:O-glycosyl hydrolase